MTQAMPRREDRHPRSARGLTKGVEDRKDGIPPRGAEEGDREETNVLN